MTATRNARPEGDALRALVEQYSRRLYRAARGMGLSADEAEDAVQEAFVTLIATIDRFEGRAQLSTWLFGILHHKVQERRRARAREELNDPIDAAFEQQFDAAGAWSRPPVAPDRSISSSELSGVIRECLAGLPPLQREVFHLRQVEELAAADVGKILAQTVTHIGVILYRARLRLRACLEAKGWSGTP